MRITKVEQQRVVERQLQFYEKIMSPIQPKYSYVPGMKLGELTYSYDYIPGVNACNPYAVYSYLADNVWSQEPLKEDNYGVYAYYILGVATTLKIKLPTLVYQLLSESENNSKCLVHGDATLENFLQTHTGIVAIDPGLPRGFCSPENDIGKILQSCLTHWNRVRHGCSAETFSWNDLMELPITGYSIASLISHWIRILNNAARHPAVVERYGRDVVIPALAKILEDYQDTPAPVRSRWRFTLVRSVYDQCLPPSS